MNLERELQVAVSAATEAGKLTENYFGKSPEEQGLSHKSPDHPVTKADIESNEVIMAQIKEAFPDDGWLSEETVDSSERLEKERVWIVDPIDGTKEFIAGIPEYVISIGLAIAGEVVLGVVYQPSQKLYYKSVKGQGAFLGDDPLKVDVAAPEKPRLLVSRSETKRGDWKVYEQDFDLHPCGSIAYKLCRVAAGEFDGVITLEPRSEWDIAAGIAILDEAGGRATLHDGSSITYNAKKPVIPTGLIAACPELVKRAVKVIGNR